MNNNNFLKEEVLRISELMGVKSGLLNEQWWKLSKLLGGGDFSDFLTHASGKLGRAVRSIDDFASVSDIFKALKGAKGKFTVIKNALVDNVVKELEKKGIKHNTSTWVQKTNRELLEDLQKAGIYGDDAIAYIKYFEGRYGVKAAKSAGGVTPSTGSITPSTPTSTKPIKFGSTTLTGPYSVDDYIDAALLDPELGPILKKSGKQDDLREVLNLSIKGGVVDQESLTRATQEYITKLRFRTKSPDAISFLDKAANLIFSKKGLMIGGFVLLAGAFFGWWTLKDAAEKAKKMTVGEDDKKKKDGEKPESGKTVVGVDANGNPIYGQD